MEPTKEIRTTLSDVLDRALDKGLVVNADIIISVAGVPLVGIKLMAVIAGMETMLAYGVMNETDAMGRLDEEELCQGR